jgi:gluconokinase
MHIPNLRSPADKVGGIYYFGRMVDKIRLNAAGLLPDEYRKNLGIHFDGRCVNFLWIEYPALAERVKKGGSDEEILEWAFSQGRKPGEEEIEIWNEFMRKRGWNDEGTATLKRRLLEGGCQDRDDIQTMFEYIDLDEGRDPKAGPAPH